MSRRIRLANAYTADEAGRCVARLLELSAEQSEDIVIVIPPTGNLSGALAIADILGMPSVAPAIGILTGPARFAAMAVLQACETRGMTPHAEIAPIGFETDHRVSPLELHASEAQRTLTLRLLRDRYDSFKRESDLLSDLFERRMPPDGRARLEVLLRNKHFFAAEAVADGWADVLIDEQSVPLRSVQDPQKSIGEALARSRCVFIGSDITDSTAERAIRDLWQLAARDDEPIVVVLDNVSGDLSTVLWLADSISLLPATVIGIGGTRVESLCLALLQACDHRCIRPDVSVDLVIQSRWSNVTVTLRHDSTFDDAASDLTESVDRRYQQLSLLASLLARRSRLSDVEVLERLKTAQGLTANDAREVGLVDTLVF